jgi:DNA-binding transcriptional ArsR family regulator
VIIIRNMSNYSNKQLGEFSEIFKALANPNRLRIFLRLASCCEPGTACCEDDETQQCAGNVGQDLGIAPSTVSHHLKELRRAGLIRMERQGKRVQCWAEPAIMKDLGDFFLQRENEKA